MTWGQLKMKINEQVDDRDIIGWIEVTWPTPETELIFRHTDDDRITVEG